MAKFDVESALRAGYTRNEIDQFMSQNNLEPEMTVGGFVKNVGRSGGRLITDTSKAITSPVQTAKGIAELVKNPKLLVDFYKQRYGKDLAQTLYEDPVGVIADLSVVLGGAGATAKALGTLTKSGEIAKVGQVLSTAGKVTDPLRVAGYGTKGIAKKAVSSVAGVADKASETFLTSGLHNRELLKGARGVQGGSLGPLYEKYNLFDKSSATFSEALDKVASSRKNIAQYSNKPIKLADIDKELYKSISNLMKEDSPEARQEISSILADRKRLKKIAGGADYVTVAQSDALRGRIDKRIPKNAFGMGLKTSAKVSGKKTVRDILKTQQNISEPKLKQLGLDESALIKLKEAATKTEGNRSGNLNFGLLKTLSGFGGYSAGGVPGALAGLAIESIVNSPAGSKAAYKTLSGVSKLPESTPRLFSRASSIGENVSSYGKYLRVPSKIGEQTETGQPQQEEMTSPSITPPRPLQFQEQSTYTPILPPDDKLKLKKYTPTLKFGRK